MRKLKQSTARSVMIFMADSSDHVTGKASLTLTITASKNGGAFGSITPTVTERGDGWYSLALTTAHTDTLGDLALHVTSTGADPTDAMMEVVAYDPADAQRMGLAALPASGESLTLSSSIDGLALSSAIEILLAVMAGEADPVGNDVIYRKRDGTTAKITITYSDVPGQRTASVVNS